MSKMIRTVVPLCCGMYEKINETVFTEPEMLRPIHPSVIAESLFTFTPGPVAAGKGGETVTARLCTYGHSWRFWVIVGESHIS